MPGFIQKISKQPDLPFYVFMSCCLVTGVFTFLDYGLSHDEPLFYAYSDAIGYAYSLPERLNGDFDIELAYGPSATDHKMYGPAYLLIARNPVAILSALTGIRRPEFWHLANFITFLSGGIFLYYLCKRWMREPAALGAVVLFVTQPVLWGHAFINPKDIPFMVFMLAALTLGLSMVDRLVAISPSLVSQADKTPQVSRWRITQKTWRIFAIAVVILTLAVLLFHGVLRGQLELLIQQAYNAEPSSIIGRIFSSLAPNAQDIEVEAYINKGLVQLNKLWNIYLIFALGLFLTSIVGAFRPLIVMNTLNKLADILAPLPTLPEWWVQGQRISQIFGAVLLPGILLGLVTSIRVIGPLAGLLVFFYFLLRYERRSNAGFGLYILIALPVIYLTWPFLWDAPIRRFIEVLRHMANNPQILSVLYNGKIIPSDELPAGYLPVMLAITLTLPVLLLFVAGVLAAAVKIYKKLIDWRSLLVVSLLFSLLFAYIILLNPPMYDGYRHFLFILPPIFVLAGLGLQFFFERIRANWARGFLLLLIALPGILGIMSSHPYQYTYYNNLVGGTSGAFRHFETDYWLTCYKETMQSGINPNPTQYPVIHVLRAPSIAEYYAEPSVSVRGYDPEIEQPALGQKTLLTTRTNVDLSLFPEAPTLYRVGLSGVDFCVVKQTR